MQDLGGISGSSVAAPSPGHAAQRASPTSSSFLRADVQDLFLLLAMVSLCWVRRVATLQPVNPGGDVVEKWEFVRQWFYGNHFAHGEWSHHMTRWGVNVLAYLDQALFGHGLRAYYIVPIGACLVQVAFVFGCALRLSGRTAAVIAATMLIYAPMMATAGSQLLPDLFTGTYGIIALYLLLCYADAKPPARTRWLIASAVVCFLGYLAKETMVFFFPGFLLAIWLLGRRLPDLAVFGIVLAAGLVLECLAYRLFTDYPSRLAIVRLSHGGDGVPTTTFLELFERYDNLDAGWVRAFYFFIAAFCGVFAFRRDSASRAVLAVVGSFLFFLTFLVRGWNPMLLWHRFQPRYFDPCAPFVELINGLFLAMTLQQVLAQLSPGSLRPGVGGQPRLGLGLVLTLASIFGVLEYSSFRRDYAGHPFKLGPAMAGLANNTYRRNLPLYSRQPATGGGSKEYYDRDLHTLYGVYMDVNLLVRDGLLPHFDTIKQVYRRYTYLVRDPDVYSPAKFTQLISNGCGVEIRERRDNFSMTPMMNLPGYCDDLLAQQLPDTE
jgi:hypothetical protein